jgi:hypothetical protein
MARHCCRPDRRCRLPSGPRSSFWTPRGQILEAVLAQIAQLGLVQERRSGLGYEHLAAQRALA